MDKAVVRVSVPENKANHLSGVELSIKERKDVEGPGIPLSVIFG